MPAESSAARGRAAPGAVPVWAVAKPSVASGRAPARVPRAPAFNGRFCKDCRYFRKGSDRGCTDEDNVRLGKCMLYPVVDPVSGWVDFVHARTVRMGVGENSCGAEGRYFEDRKLHDDDAFIF